MTIITASHAEIIYSKKVFYVLKRIKKDELPYACMHAIRHIVPIYTVFTARSCSREGRDRPLAESCLNLLDFFLLISARCLPGCDEQHGHCNRPNECMWVYIHTRLSPNTYMFAGSVYMLFVCVVCMCTLRRPIQPPTKFLGPDTVHPLLCMHRRRGVCMYARDNNYAYTYRKLSFGAISKIYAS